MSDKAIALDTQNIQKSKLVPAIRFEGFSEGWEDNNLQQVVDVRSGRDYKHLSIGDIPVFGTGGYMLSVNEALSYDEDAIGIGRKGTINKPYVLKAPFWTVDTLFYAVPYVKNNLDFVYAIFQKINWRQKDESTGVPSLSKVAINNIPVFTTDKIEQTKIGNYFQQLDTLIAQHQKKHDTLLKLKKSLLEKLLPKQGSTKPEIRFKGFSGEWEEKALGNIVNELYNGQTPSRIIDSYWNGNINWLSSGELNRAIVKDTIEKITLSGKKSANLKVVPKGTFVIAITGLEAVGTRGNCAILGINTTLNQSCMAIFPNSKLLQSNFLFQWYRLKSEEYGQTYTQGTKQQSYNAEIVKKLCIVTPKLREQTKIGNLFKQLDTLIKQHQTQLKKLANIKQACLAKMFV